MSDFMGRTRVPVTDTELTKEEMQVILKALGHYQVYLFDEMMKKSGKESELKTESQVVTSAIKKIHSNLEKS